MMVIIVGVILGPRLGRRAGAICTLLGDMMIISSVYSLSVKTCLVLNYCDGPDFNG